MKKFFLFVMICGSAALVAAVDFGAALGGSATAENNEDVSIKATLAPWLSLPMNNADFFVSLGATANYKEEIQYVPELFRLEFEWRPAASFAVRAGRIPWLDTTHFTAKGNFDGADILYDFGSWRLGAAALYTGFLFKETAEINASPTDPIDYYVKLDYADFAGTYFAPRRVIAALYGEFPSLVLERGDLYAGVLAQFDLSDAEEAFHTQYLLLRYTHVYKRFDVTAAAALELENTEAGGFKAGYAFALEGGWHAQVPFFIKDRLSLGVRYASGEDPSTAAFYPVVREAQGIALKPVFSGIMVLRANYEARILPSLSAELGVRYFIRTDSISYIPDDITDDSYLIGAEIDTSILWVPFSDLSFSLSGGIFLPQTGEAFRSGAPVVWSLSIGAIFSF
ncbi:MAG: hypothetical protein FWG07_06800 [Treponema sp.]|nr:hypothetical protein [Treponema sp.]